MTGISDRQTDRILGKARKALQPSGLPQAFNEAAPSADSMSHERLQAAYEALATIISVHGEEYLPLFKRLHTELAIIKRNEEYVKLAKAIHEKEFRP